MRNQHSSNLSLVERVERLEKKIVGETSSIRDKYVFKDYDRKWDGSAFDPEIYFTRDSGKLLVHDVLKYLKLNSDYKKIISLGFSFKKRTIPSYGDTEVFFDITKIGQIKDSSKLMRIHYVLVFYKSGKVSYSFTSVSRVKSQYAHGTEQMSVMLGSENKYGAMEKRFPPDSIGFEDFLDSAMKDILKHIKMNNF